MFDTHRAPLRFIRRLLRPVLKLFFNPNPVSEALHIQAQVNQRTAEALARIETLHYELIHNLVVEITRLGIEVKNLKMRVESVSGRLDFDERRARALEGVVQYKTGSIPAPRPAPSQERPAPPEGGGSVPPAGERRRRRRRRGRRRHEGLSETGTGPSAEPTGTAGQGDAPLVSSVDSGHDSSSRPVGPTEDRSNADSAVPVKADSTES
jgi:hypothetical protein